MDSVLPFIEEMSPPPRGAWIETIVVVVVSVACLSPPPRGAWIETEFVCINSERTWSPPPRGAWIETPLSLGL